MKLIFPFFSRRELEDRKSRTPATHTQSQRSKPEKLQTDKTVEKRTHDSNHKKKNHRRSASAHGVGGLSEHKARVASGSASVPSSVRSQAGKLEEQGNTVVQRSSSAADLLDPDMFTKASQYFQVRDLESLLDVSY